MNALTVTLIGIRTTVMSVLALVAFAGNSVLCRIALSDGAIHPASFTSVRLSVDLIFVGVVVELW